MRIEEISNTEAGIFVLCVIGFAIWLFRTIPAPDGLAREPVVYSETEITSYDSKLPKHFIAAMLALAIGGFHAALKSLPPVYTWLSEAGEGGHLVRDIANSHLVIVVGGTVAATGLIWYALPRAARRPLYSATLANISFWFTVAGASGFYLVNVGAGLVMGWLSHERGIETDLNAWRAVPLGISATVMGIGYWTFVLNVVVTAWGSRRAAGPKPQGHLVKFFVVGALGLFAGTVQGVYQVMPDQEAWIKATGEAGDYIDPIAHAHVNLVTGLLMLVAGLAFSFSRVASPRRRRLENTIFWVLAPASIAFYLTFLTLGLTEGRMMLRDGITFEAAVDRLGWLHTAPLIVAGTLTLSGVWLLLGTLAWRFGRGPERSLPGALFVVAASVGLFIGTSQGLVQLLPGVKSWLDGAGESGDAIVNAHAQLNMLGGVILALIGLTIAGGKALLPEAVPARSARRALPLTAVGAAVYFVSAVATALVIGDAVHSGLTPAEGLRRAQPFGPFGMAAGAALYALGSAIIAEHLWESTAEYRREGRASFRRALREYEGPTPSWRARAPLWVFPASEAAFAVFGFPGIGWMISGRPLIGLPLALASPGIAWALLPTLASPYGDGPLSAQGGEEVVLSYITITAVLSVAALTTTVVRQRRRSRGRWVRPTLDTGGRHA